MTMRSDRDQVAAQIAMSIQSTISIPSVVMRATILNLVSCPASSGVATHTSLFSLPSEPTSEGNKSLGTRQIESLVAIFTTHSRFTGIGRSASRLTNVFGLPIEKFALAA